MDIFSHLFVGKIVMFVWKDENKRKRGPIFKKYSLQFEALSLSFIFIFSNTHCYNFYNKHMWKNVPPVYKVCKVSNSQPSEHDSPPINTRPGLLSRVLEKVALAQPYRHKDSNPGSLQPNGLYTGALARSAIQAPVFWYLEKLLKCAKISSKKFF